MSRYARHHTCRCWLGEPSKCSGGQGCGLQVALGRAWAFGWHVYAEGIKEHDRLSQLQMSRKGEEIKRFLSKRRVVKLSFSKTLPQ